MPQREDIDTVLIVGAGPIIIGQACEFDYSGVQALRALRSIGYKTVLLNSNPATIMTDPELADRTYAEPVTPWFLERVIEKERREFPNDRLAILPTMGGQTALNVTLELAQNGALDRLGVELIGARADSIERAEDRGLFRRAMERIGLNVPKSGEVRSLEEAEAILKRTRLPSIIRPSFTLGGTGGGIARTHEDFQRMVHEGLEASPVRSVLIEESVLGWKEFELEVVRDHKDNCIIVCGIENIDPMGVHTGDSITVAPIQTLTDKEYQVMRDSAIAVLREIGVDTGGSNVQFAVDPKTGRQLVIEMNPRVSRSSALASKATGFPIAKVAAQLAVGLTLDEIQNDITGGVMPASFEPTLDYVVTKIPRFAFEKFRGASEELGVSMKSVGEAMAIGGNFAESLQKALRSLEQKIDGLDERELPVDHETLAGHLARPTPDRLLQVAQAIREGHSVGDIAEWTGIDLWFLRQLGEIIAAEKNLMGRGDKALDDPTYLRNLKALGFSDGRIAKLISPKGAEGVARVRAAREAHHLHPTFKRIDSTAGEFRADAAYLYSTYDHGLFDRGEDEVGADPSRKKVVVLGSGPNRIGQGIEFDYCCVHAAQAVRASGREVIMVNCNPETVSTDYDLSDRLYFEPLTEEDVLEVLAAEARSGTLQGVIVQFGGQTPLGLSAVIDSRGYSVLGTPPDAIDLAEDRERFDRLLEELGLQRPESGLAHHPREAKAIADRLGYPLLIRPSYVLGGRAMEIVCSEADLNRFLAPAFAAGAGRPVLIDRFLAAAIEVDVDVISAPDGVEVVGIMEHIEEAGIHSGDSACVLPPYTLAPAIVDRIAEQSKRLARALGARGLMNIQFAVSGDTIYVLEVNPRASRTAPFVAKAIGVPVVRVAAFVQLGMTLADALREAGGRRVTRVAVKEAVFPFSRFPGTDVLLGPEMKSTGEVIGLDRTFARAFTKAQLGCQADLPLAPDVKGDQGSCDSRDAQAGPYVYMSAGAPDRPAILEAAKIMARLGFRICSPAGTFEFFNAEGVACESLPDGDQFGEGLGGVKLLFNIQDPTALDPKEGMKLRLAALNRKIPYYTTARGCMAAALAMEALLEGPLEPLVLQG